MLCDSRSRTLALDSRRREEDQYRGVNDLFTGRVRAIELVERPQVPTAGQNATGDNITTDAKMAVLLFP